MNRTAILVLYVLIFIWISLVEPPRVPPGRRSEHGLTDWWRLARGGDRTRLDKRTQQAVCEGGQISLITTGLVLLTHLPSSSSLISVRTRYHGAPDSPSLQAWHFTSRAVPLNFFVNTLQGSHDIDANQITQGSLESRVTADQASVTRLRTYLVVQIPFTSGKAAIPAGVMPQPVALEYRVSGVVVCCVSGVP
ncbi:hypothetical protein E2C01_017939 [Portunus trituberculatus]|uniref:Uncharacterized protein n=1 Tax=Portunus trituberculatus TaxID=210409 RepID=A0A5B7DU63_PORTR|nr:hypothetical protein [Portunus trituberculatus]